MFLELVGAQYACITVATSVEAAFLVLASAHPDPFPDNAQRYFGFYIGFVYWIMRARPYIGTAAARGRDPRGRPRYATRLVDTA